MPDDDVDRFNRIIADALTSTSTSEYTALDLPGDLHCRWFAENNSGTAPVDSISVREQTRDGEVAFVHLDHDGMSGLKRVTFPGEEPYWLSMTSDGIEEACIYAPDPSVTEIEHVDKLHTEVVRGYDLGASVEEMVDKRLAFVREEQRASERDIAREFAEQAENRMISGLLAQFADEIDSRIEEE